MSGLAHVRMVDGAIAEMGALGQEQVALGNKCRMACEDEGVIWKCRKEGDWLALKGSSSQKARGHLSSVGTTKPKSALIYPKEPLRFGGTL